MALKSYDPRRHPGGNSKLGPALARFAEDPTRRHRAEMLESLLAGPLLIALDGLPCDFDPDESAEGRICFITAEGPRKRRAICGFSSAAALVAKAPAAVALAVDPTSLLSWIVEMDLEGLLLDPRGASAFVSNGDARGLLGLPRKSGRGRSISLAGGSDERAREALEGLQKDADSNARILLREPRTGKSVLFRKASDDGLLMVLAGQRLADDERTRAGMFFAQLAGDDDLPPAENATAEASPDFVAMFTGDTARPAEAAVKIFAWVFGFPPGFELEVDRDAIDD
jgi:hypothetical protein